MQKFTDEQLEAAGWLLIYKQLPPLATPVLALTEGGVADVCKMYVNGRNLEFINAFRPQHSNGGVIAWKPLGLPEEADPEAVSDYPEAQRAELVHSYLQQIKSVVDAFRAGSAGARSSLEHIHGIIQRLQDFGTKAQIQEAVESKIPEEVLSVSKHMGETLNLVSKFIAAHLEESESVAPAIHEIKELLYRRGFYPPNKPE